MIKKLVIKKMALEILFGKDCDVTKTWQEPFHGTITCDNCKNNMILMLQVHDDGAEVVRKIPDQIVNARGIGKDLMADALTAIV